MSKFLTALEVQEIEDTSHSGRGTWKLLQTFRYISDVASKTIEVPAGFVTDFASVPRLPVLYLLAGDTAHKAAVLHDWLYVSCEVSRYLADSVLQEAALLSGVPVWRARLMWLAVRIAGGAFYGAKASK